MERLQKFKPAILISLIATIVVYVFNIITTGLYANDFAQITSNVQNLSNLFEGEQLKMIMNVVDIATGALLAYKAFSIGIIFLTAVFTIVIICLIRFMQDKHKKTNKTLYLIILTLLSGYLAYFSIQGLKIDSGLAAMSLLALNVYNFIVFLLVTIFGIHAVYKQFKQDFQKQAWIKNGSTIIASLSLVLIVLLTINIAFKVIVYISIVSFITSIDLANLIDVMDYINVDLAALLPSIVGSGGIVSQAQAELFINQLADKSILAYASNMLHQVLSSFSFKLIFDNLVVIGIGFITAICSLVYAHKVEEPEQIADTINGEEVAIEEVASDKGETKHQYLTEIEKVATKERDYIILLIFSILTSISAFFISSSFVYALIGIVMLIGSSFILFGIIKQIDN